MNKKIVIQGGTGLLLALLLNLSCTAQVVFSEWITGTGTRGWDLVNDMTCDRAGNIYITGSFTDTLVTSKSAAQSKGRLHTMYVARFDTSGAMTWKKNILNQGSGFGSLIGKGNKDEIILAGGEVLPNRRAGVATGRAGFYISSLSSKGAVNWSQSFTGSKSDYLTAMIVDTQKAEILLTGYFHDTLTLGKKRLISGGMSDGLFLRFDLNGNLKEAQVIGGKGEDKISGMAIDSVGNCYVAGTFQQKIQVGNKIAFALNNRQEQGMFLACYNNEGAVVAAKHLATGKKVRVHSVAVAGGHILIAGSFSDNLTIDNKILSSQGSDDVILLCLDRNLQLTWYRQIGGAKKERASKMISMGHEIVLSGSFCSTIHIEGKELTAAGTGSDVFIVAFDTSGNLRWMRRAGGNADDYPTCMIAAPEGYIYLAGSYREKFNLNGKILQSAGEEDVFIGRLENCKAISPKFHQPEYFCEGGLLHLDAGAGFVSYNWVDGLSHDRTFDIDRQGRYPLGLIAKNGCMIYDTIGVAEVPLPVVKLRNDTTLADTSAILLHAGGDFSNYLWNNGCTRSENLIKGVNLKEGGPTG